MVEFGIFLMKAYLLACFFIIVMLMLTAFMLAFVQGLIERIDRTWRGRD